MNNKLENFLTYLIGNSCLIIAIAVMIYKILTRG